MSTCTFFGHHDCPASIRPKLREVLIDLIENRAVDRFFVGDNGAFDRMVRACLRELAKEYPQIRYAVVLEHMPEKRRTGCHEDDSDTMLPEGLEKVPPRFAISRRNQWMLRQCDCVVTYITHSWGGAAQFAEMATRQKKAVFDLTDSRTQV